MINIVKHNIQLVMLLLLLSSIDIDYGYQKWKNQKLNQLVKKNDLVR